MNQNIIYQDDLFTFTEDDIYIIHSINNIYFYLNVSIYFNMHYSLFARENNFVDVNTKTNHKKLFYIGQLTRTDVHNNFPNSSINVLLEYFLFSYIETNGLSLIPGNMELKHLNLSIFRMDDFLKKSKYSLQTKDKLPYNRRITNRRCRSSHHDMSINKQFHKIYKQEPLILNIRTTADSKQEGKEKIRILRAYHKRMNRVNNIVYKRAKKLNTIKTYPLVDSPLLFIKKIIYNILSDKSENLQKFYAVQTSLLLNNNIIDYRSVRMIFILISIGAYDTAFNILLNKSNEIYRTNSYINTIGINNTGANTVIDVKININKKTIDKYKKKFDLMYYYISKCTYNDFIKLSNTIKYIRKNKPEKMAIKTSENKYVNNKHAHNSTSLELYRNRMIQKNILFNRLIHRLTSNSLLDKSLDPYQYMMNNIKHEVKNIFKSYSRIADITSANADNEFVYLFCPEIVYNRIMTNKAAYGAGKYNTKHKPKCFIKIKRK